MKAWLLLALAVSLCACGKSSPSHTPEAPAKANGKASPPMVNSGTESTPAILTREQLESTLSVRLSVGGLPPHDYAAALLHRDEIPIKAAVSGPGRFAIAYLKNCSEKQVRNATTQILVSRHRADRQGDLAQTTLKAQLCQYDPQTGLAVICFADNFDYSQDVGFHIDRTATTKGSFTALRTTAGKSRVSSGVEGGACVQLAGGNSVRLPAFKEQSNDEIYLAVQGTDTLLGFIEPGESDSASLFRLSDFQWKVETWSLKERGVAFGKVNGTTIAVGIATEGTTSEDYTEGVILRVRQLSGDPQRQLPSSISTDVSAPIESANEFRLFRRKKGEPLATDLQLPMIDGEECTYQLQLSWPLVKGASRVKAYGRPFSIKFKRAGENLLRTVEGLPDLNELQQASQTPVSKFLTEAPVIDFAEVAGGREVVMHLDGPPFWKRFSFAHNDWLPLPAGDLSKASITGNLTSLYILDRGAAEVRKYNLADLKLVSSTKLPAAIEYVAAFTGCNSEHAPVYIASRGELLVLAPDTLQLRNAPIGSSRTLAPFSDAYTSNSRFFATGDGLATVISPGASSTSFAAFCADETRGLLRKAFDIPEYWMESCCVSGAYTISQDYGLSTVARAGGELFRTNVSVNAQDHSRRWALPNSPTSLRFFHSDQAVLPPQPPRVEFTSFFDSSPFATVEVPELDLEESKSLDGRTRWISFDPFTLRAGVLAADRKSWVVHTVSADARQKQPVLLNWPDAVVVRGKKLQFKPELLGGDKFSVELKGSTTSVSPVVTGGGVSLTIAPDEVASLMLLSISVPGKEGPGLVYSIPLHTAGPQFPVAAPLGAGTPDLNAFGASFKLLGRPADGWKLLNSTTHFFPEKIKQVLEPVAGHIPLLTASQRILFLSAKTRSVVGSIAAPAKATYYSGAGALYEYDNTTRTISRISVPDGKRETSLPLPNGLRLHALAVGTEASSPLTLILEQLTGNSTEQLNNLTVTTTTFNRTGVVLNSRTLRGGGWAQPKMWKQEESTTFYNSGRMTEAPRRLPSSHNGQFVTSPHGFFTVLGQGVSMIARLPGKEVFRSLDDQNAYSPTGSISGMRISDVSGISYTGGISDTPWVAPDRAIGVSTCGRYSLHRISRDASPDSALEVRSAENNTAIFRVGRISLMNSNYTFTKDDIAQHFAVISDEGPLAILAAGGETLQLIDFNIPQIAREVCPPDFHVTSQPAPCIMQGTALDYQIQVNNPAAVASYRIQDAGTSITISPTGLLHYTAPAHVTEPTRVEISAEIVGKSGRTLLHRFPVFVLPPFPPEAPKTPDPNRRPSI